jgi:hypothetical protein
LDVHLNFTKSMYKVYFRHALGLHFHSNFVFDLFSITIYIDTKMR